MNIKDDWQKVKFVLVQGQASSIYCSIATVNPDSTPHITPVGTVFLRDEDVTDYPKLGKRLSRNSGEWTVVEHAAITTVKRKKA